MNINTGIGNTQPNFKARLKNNDLTKKIVNRMDDKEAFAMREALTKLSKVAPDDVLEIKYLGKSGKHGSVCGIVNEARNKQVVIGGVNGQLVDILNKASEKGSEMYNRLFESDGDKAKKDIFDMMV